MAYGIVHHFPGGTKEQYEAVKDKVHPKDGLPKGHTDHYAGTTDQGFMVMAIWDSKDSYDDFMQNTLGPALAELGDKAFPNPPSTTEMEVQNEEQA